MQHVDPPVLQNYRIIDNVKVKWWLPLLQDYWQNVCLYKTNMNFRSSALQDHCQCCVLVTNVNMLYGSTALHDHWQYCVLETNVRVTYGSSTSQDHWQRAWRDRQAPVDHLWWRRGPGVGGELELCVGWQQTADSAEWRTTRNTSKCRWLPLCSPRRCLCDPLRSESEINLFHNLQYIFLTDNFHSGLLFQCTDRLSVMQWQSFSVIIII